jgi:hypothetical protein
MEQFRLSIGAVPLIFCYGIDSGAGADLQSAPF